MTETAVQIIDIISDQLCVPKDKIQMNSVLRDDLGADSLDTVEVIHALEEKFDIEIADEDIMDIKTVEDIIKQISAKIT